MILHQKQIISIAIIILCLGIIIFPLLAEETLFAPYIQQVVAKLPLRPNPPKLNLDVTLYKNNIQISNASIKTNVSAWCVKVYPDIQQRQALIDFIKLLQQQGYAAFLQQDKAGEGQVFIGPELDQAQAQRKANEITKTFNRKTSIERYAVLGIE